MPLVTKETYEKMPPFTQGFTQYWEGAQPGSELRDLTNPYPAGSAEHNQWNEGQALATQEAQDSEE